MDNIDGFPNDAETKDQMQYIVSGVIFVLLMSIGGFVYALFAPKPPKTVSDSDLKAERLAMARAERQRKKRRREAHRKMSEERKQRLE